MLTYHTHFKRQGVWHNIKNQNSEDIHFTTTLLALTLIKTLYQDNVINKKTYEACIERYEKDIQHEWEELEPKLRIMAEQKRAKKNLEKS